jgi:RHS repeat-associated protein
VLQATLGNGLVQTRSYNAFSGRQDHGLLALVDGTPRLQESYLYDEIGSVTQRNQQWDTGGFIEDFTYDVLNRLDKSRVAGQPWQQMLYFADGSIRRKPSAGSGDYQYPTGPNPLLPHAVQSIPGIPGLFQYDANGNLINGNNRTAEWTSFDMPSRITKATDTTTSTSTFAYGPEHQRTLQVRDNTTIVYAGPQEVETTGSQITVKTYWPGGLGVEIEKIGVSTDLIWTHHDRLGSMIALSGSTGTLVERLAYDAWGKRRILNGVPVGGTAIPDSIDGVLDNKGFTGHEMLDQLDLVHMNGRIYDPLIARFLSGDPLVQDPTNGQSYNRYSYVMNNPTNLTDPTGFMAQGDSLRTESERDRNKFEAAAEKCHGNCSALVNGNMTLTVQDGVIVDATVKVDSGGNTSPNAQAPAANSGSGGLVGAVGNAISNGLTAANDAVTSQPVVNAVAGFGDTLSFHATAVVRTEVLSVNNVDQSSNAYGYGEKGATVMSASLGVAHIGRNLLMQMGKQTGLKALKQGATRIISDPRKWESIRRTWSNTAGKGVAWLNANKQSLHHWMIPQRWFQRIGTYNGSWNYMAISARLNSYMNSSTSLRILTEWSFRGAVVGIYGAPVTAGITEATAPAKQKP